MRETWVLQNVSAVSFRCVNVSNVGTLQPCYTEMGGSSQRIRWPTRLDYITYGGAAKLGFLVS